jgi:lipopolysaccharide transport system ATP-binding protein
MSIAVKVEDVSKRYRLGVINRDMLYKDLQSRWAKWRGKPDPNAPIAHVHQDRIEKGDEFWALRNVSLEIQEGEVYGIIGRNGAGKSTLLKILSQITAPTEGQIKIKGRIASLLEVGTGFHPELTGRENVFLNGAILGMSRCEIKSKFDEIVNFSEIEEFIDTPVKRYSSGMYVRLAFGVAAHLDPDILIVDEVLAVGDAGFQKKCIGKMNSVAGEGKTVILVTHSMALAQSLTKVSVWLDQGRIKQVGDTERVVKSYLQHGENMAVSAIDGLSDYRLRRGSGHARVSSIAVCDQSGARKSKFERGENLTFKVELSVVKQCSSLGLSVAFKLGLGTALQLSTQLFCLSGTEVNVGSKLSVDLAVDTSTIPAAIYDLYIWVGPVDHGPNEYYDILDSLLAPIEICENLQDSSGYMRLKAAANNIIVS